MAITRKIINDNDDLEMICLVLQLENRGEKPWHQRAECRGMSNLFTVKSMGSTMGRHRNQGGRRSSSLDHEPSLRLSIRVGQAVEPLQAVSVDIEADKGSLTCDRKCSSRRNLEAAIIGMCGLWGSARRLSHTQNSLCFSCFKAVQYLPP